MSAELLNTEDGCHPTGWEAFGQAYGQHEQTHITVETETMAWLLKCEAILQALMKRGVHIFDGYDAAMNDVMKGKE